MEIREVFPLDAAFREQFLHRPDILINERVVFVPAHAVLPESEVQRVVEQLLVIGPDIKHHRQGELRRHSRAGGVERELPDRDPHPADPLVAEPEDPLAVGDHDEPDVLLRPVRQDFLHPPARGDRQIHPAGRAKEPVELLARLPDRRRVNERHERRRIRHEHRVKQRLVTDLQVAEKLVFLKIPRERVELDMDPADLDFERILHRRQEPLDPQCPPLGSGKCAAFVRAGIPQCGDACRVHRPVVGMPPVKVNGRKFRVLRRCGTPQLCHPDG